MLPGMKDKDSIALQAPGRAEIQILMIGRIEHPGVKGVDIGAAATGIYTRDNEEVDVKLHVLGCKKGKSAEDRTRLENAAACPTLDVLTFEFDSSPGTVARFIGRGSLLLMPSREEGFGLVGLEAIEVGVPVLISGNSGLAEHMRRVLPPDFANKFIVRTPAHRETAAAAWAERIAQAMADRDGAFSLAAELRAKLRPSLNWANEAKKLSDAWEKILGSNG